MIERRHYGTSYRTNPHTGYTIGRYIRESRLAQRFSVRYTALLTGISAYRLKQYETDQRQPPPDALWALCQALTMRPTEAFRCAKMPGAWTLPSAMEEPPARLTAHQFAEMQRYVDLLAGRDPTEHPDRDQPTPERPLP